MSDSDLLHRYNYAEFSEETAFPWVRFDESPDLGQTAPDFPLWTLDERETALSAIWGENLFTVVEFGSFT